LALIYLFEDDPSLRSLLAEMLHDEVGAQVEACPSKAELQQRCAMQRPDLIVADFWGTSHLRLDESERHEISALGRLAPLVLVSARNWTHGVEPGDLGIAALVSKPLDLERFASIIQATLSKDAPNLTA
jgi:DNA-binding response OmpR family regulator